MNETKVNEYSNFDIFDKDFSKNRKRKKQNKNKKNNGIFKAIICVLLVIIVLIAAAWKFGLFNMFSSDNMSRTGQLTTYTVSRRTITQSLTSSGTLEPNDSYTITPLVSGEILSDYFEEGDIVEEDQLLYRIDSSNIESSIKRAQNSLKNAQKNLDNAIKEREKLNVKSDVAGNIEKIYVEVGDEISAGTKIADVIDKEIMLIDVPFIADETQDFYVGQPATLTFPSFETATGTIKEIKGTTGVNELGAITRIITISVNNIGSITTSTSAYASVGNSSCTAPSVFYYNDEGQVISKIAGTVESINYTEGSRVTEDSIVVNLSSSDVEDRIESLELTLDDAQSSLNDTLDNHENYNITSPISGTVISKNYKAGDTLGSGSGNSGSASMAVIYDLSAFKFTMNIDELDIDKIKVGQEVIVTSDARSGTQYYGNVTNISIQGSTSNGTTIYPVTVTIDNVEDESKRKTDEGGTIHKYYKTGKTSTTKKHTLESKLDNTYAYSDGVTIERIALEDGTPSFSVDGKNMNPKFNSTYTLGSDTYTFSDDMNSLIIETVDESTMLRPGMNIDAEILIQNVENVVAVPVSAIMRGYKVKVVSRAENDAVEDKTPNGIQNDKSTEAEKKSQMTGNIPNGIPKFDAENTQRPEVVPSEEGMPVSGNQTDSQYGAVPHDTQYEEVRVSVGVTDNNFIEITEGLNVGDVVILDEMNSIGSQTGTVQMQGFGGMGGMGGMSGMGGMGDYDGVPMGGGMMRPIGR